MLDREPNRYDELKKIHEAAREQAKQEGPREQEARLQAGKSTHDVEAHMAAFEKQLDVVEKLGRITRSEKIDLLRREDNRVTMEINKGVHEFPKPEIDADRMLIDLEYRRGVFQKQRDTRQYEQNGARQKTGPQRTDSEEHGR
jgi:hypothetical protein